jgi:hypothetical protein
MNTKLSLASQARKRRILSARPAAPGMNCPANSTFASTSRTTLTMRRWSSVTAASVAKRARSSASSFSGSATRGATST